MQFRGVCAFFHFETTVLQSDKHILIYRCIKSDHTILTIVIGMGMVDSATFLVFQVLCMTTVKNRSKRNEEEIELMLHPRGIPTDLTTFFHILTDFFCLVLKP